MLTVTRSHPPKAHSEPGEAWQDFVYTLHIFHVGLCVHFGGYTFLAQERETSRDKKHSFLDLKLNSSKKMLQCLLNLSPGLKGLAQTQQC